MMMAEKWLRSGPNWIWATWNGDAQLIYLLERNPLSLSEQYAVHKRVAGAADPTGYIVGMSTDLEDAKAMAEKDAEGPL